MSVLSETLIIQNEAGTASPHRQGVSVGARMDWPEFVSVHACNMFTNSSQYTTHIKGGLVVDTIKAMQVTVESPRSSVSLHSSGYYTADINMSSVHCSVSKTGMSPKYHLFHLWKAAITPPSLVPHPLIQQQCAFLQWVGLVTLPHGGIGASQSSFVGDSIHTLCNVNS